MSDDDGGPRSLREEESFEPRDDDWDALIGRTLDEEMRNRVLQRAVNDLNRVIELRPDYGERVLASLGAKIERQRVALETWSQVEQMLFLGVGVQPARLIAWLVSDENYYERMTEIRALLSPAAEAFVRTILSDYGRMLDAALFVFSGGYPDDWRNIIREVGQEHPTGRFTVRLRIDTYSGQTLSITTSPDGLLGFATALLATANTLNDAAAFERDPSAFIEQAERITTLLRPSLDHNSPSQDDEASIGSPFDGSPAMKD